MLDSGRRAYVLTQLVGPVGVGDRVVVNTTAVDLGLGTGGWDVVHWNLARDEWSAPGPGPVMKLRYTSLQADTGAAEELPSYSEDDLRLPVVACSLHSQVACVAAVLKHLAPERRLVYVMTDGGALPMALSDLVADLRQAALLDATVTAAHAFGGDYEAVSLHSALHVARTVARADVVVAGMGPGGVGTGGGMGFSALEVAAILDATKALSGHPIAAVRYSQADPRDRHRGVSHHTRTVLELLLEAVAVAIPAGERPADERHEWRALDVDLDGYAASGLPMRSMGREDPLFFSAALAAGRALGQMT